MINLDFLISAVHRPSFSRLRAQSYSSRIIVDVNMEILQRQLPCSALIVQRCQREIKQSCKQPPKQLVAILVGGSAMPNSVLPKWLPNVLQICRDSPIWTIADKVLMPQPPSAPDNGRQWQTMADILAPGTWHLASRDWACVATCARSTSRKKD